MRLPHRRPRRVVPARVAHPRRRREPYLAFAATIAAGLHGIEHGLDPGPRFDGNAYAAPISHVCPTAASAHRRGLVGSKVAADVFGDDVHDHLRNIARQEWAHFNRAVTDWERRRNFDQW